MSHSATTELGRKKAERVIALCTEHKHSHALLSWFNEPPRLVGHQRCRPSLDAILQVWIVDNIEIDEDGGYHAGDEEDTSKGVGINLETCWHDEEHEGLN